MEANMEAIRSEEISQTNDKAFLVALLMKQFAQIHEMGFLGTESDQWLTRIENILKGLDVKMLVGIARGAQNLLLAELVSEDR
jgi:hypothetical protein